MRKSGRFEAHYGTCSCCGEKYFSIKCEWIPVADRKGFEEVLRRFLDKCGASDAGEARRLDNKMHN